jgi:hypothetical protein
VSTSRRPVIALAVAAVSLLGLTACSSDPSAQRVAEDLVNTVAADEPEVRDCMLEVIDGYTNDELQAIGEDANDGDAAEQAAAREALDKFEADLAACRE